MDDERRKGKLNMNHHRTALGFGILLTTGAAALVSVASCGDDDLVTPPSGPTTATVAGSGGAGGTDPTGSSGAGGDTSGTAGSGAATSGTGGTAGAGGTTVDVDAGEGGPPGTTIMVLDDIVANTTWTANNVYVIPRLKQLFVKSNAVLTIEPGTVVKGEQGSILVITRGSKIEAAGTKEKPILLTAAQPDGMKTAGWWGGLLVLGSAPINVNALSAPPSTEATFEAFTASVPEGKFGGTNPNDNSGTLKYVRIEFAGFNFVADREFNNLTLCGVGDATVVDYVQVHHGADDGIELFGGTVNVKHIVSSQNEDDGFDTDNGWVGKAQFVIVQNINPNGAAEAANGYESDNHAVAASWRATPRTLPTVYNVTLLGKKDYAGGSSFAAILRRGTGGKYYNHIFQNFPLGIEVRDLETKEQLDASNLFIKNSIFFNNAASNMNWPPAQATNDVDEKSYFENAAWNNRQADPGLTAAAFNATAPNFKPADGAAALTGGATPPDDGFFDATATFVGAVGPTDWTAGWTSYPQVPAP
jgi:hypothetical protein